MKKSLWQYLTEAVQEYRAEQALAVPSPQRPIWQRLQWFIPNGGTLLIALLLILTQQVWATPTPQDNLTPGPSATTVNYQGHLADINGLPQNGTLAMSFSIFDALTGGAPVWGPETYPAVVVTDGLFNVGLGSLTNGGIPTTVWNGDRYLEISVAGETLTPRELIRSVPIAGMALTVPDGAISTNQIVNGAITSTKIANNAITTNQLVNGAVNQLKAPSLLQGQSNNTQVRWGDVVFTPDANGNATVTFGSFPTITDVFVAINGDYLAGDFVVSASSLGANFASVHLTNMDGSPRTGVSRVLFVAVGH